MAFKLGSETRGFNVPPSMSGIASKIGQIKIGQLEEGTLGEANMDGSISVDESVDLDSPFGKKLLKHEGEHVNQIASGRAGYGEGHVMWEGKIYFRNNGMIDGPNGRFPEGYAEKKDGKWVGHPWEIEAINAEKK